MHDLSEKQKSRIKARQQKQVEEFTRYPEYHASQQAIVLEPMRKTALLELEDGSTRIANVRKTSGKLACGDYVLWEALEDNDIVVTNVLPRRSELIRRYHSSKKTIASNIDQIIIVIAAVPAPDFKLLDRYTVVAEQTQLPVAIVLNKIDLLKDIDSQNPPFNLSAYEAIGYPVFLTSAKKHSGIDELMSYMSGSSSILVGQSGVGKSSILQELLPADDIRVGPLNIFEHGSHTTSSIRLYRFPDGGSIIDAPGIRDFGFWDFTPTDIISGFIEFQEFSGGCRFSNCTHTVEPKCAVKAAVESGDINPQRYEHFVILYNEANETS
jgi:ribosome biogenesis GTPase